MTFFGVKIPTVYTEAVWVQMHATEVATNARGYSNISWHNCQKEGTRRINSAAF